VDEGETEGEGVFAGATTSPCVFEESGLEGDVSLIFLEDVVGSVVSSSDCALTSDFESVFESSCSL